MYRISHDFSHGKCWWLQWCFADGVASQSSSRRNKRGKKPWWPYCSTIKISAGKVGNNQQACLSSVRGPSIGSSTNIQSDLPRNRYIGRMDNVTVNPWGNSRGLMRTNKRKLQEGQIQAVPNFFFWEVENPRATPCWSALSCTLADDNVQEWIPNACRIFILDCYGFRNPIKLGTNTANVTHFFIHT